MTRPTPSRRRITLAGLVAGGLAVAFAVAFLVSPWASSSPDGLERVAVDHGFAGDAVDSAAASGPLADYAVRGVDDGRLSTGLAGIIGVAATFAVAIGVYALLRLLRRRRVEVAD